MSTADADLGELLAQVLPAGVKVTIRHLSSTPTPCAALFAAPPGEEQEATICANHFLSVSIRKTEDDNGSEIIVFGIEVPVYGTAHLTTIFVSKADSTGYLHLLHSTAKVSLLRLITHTFLSFLVRTHRRQNVRLVLSLFARAQNQYLFPGSIHNAHKHVLDDRGLIKWWCRVADPILREYESESDDSDDKGLLDRARESTKSSATAFLIVPGCDQFETRGFFPPAAKTEDEKERPRWVNRYPVRQLCHNLCAPTRCLIPRLPDDPKTRFLVDLDDELLDEDDGADGKDGNEEQKKRAPGQWWSVWSLEQFWEVMAFRQECSAGRLVGFLWVVINPPGLENSVQMASSSVPTNAQSAAKEPVEEQSKEASSEESEQTEAAFQSKEPEETQKLNSPPFDLPETGRGHVLSEADYKTAIEFLLTQDFDNEEVSTASTKAWAEELASLAEPLGPGTHVEGRNIDMGKPVPQPLESSSPGNLLGSGLIRKRRKESQNQGGGEEQRTETEDGVKPAPQEPTPVNVLSTNLVRKKKKT